MGLGGPPPFEGPVITTHSQGEQEVTDPDRKLKLG